jgi:hypothetical protein
VAKLSASDKKKIVAALPRDLIRVLKAHPGQLFVGGGFLRDVILGEWPKDIDVFGTNADLVRDVAMALGTDRGPDHLKPTVYSITVRGRHEADWPIQFVWTWPVADCLTAISRMDFTMCQAGIWWNKGQWRSVASAQFADDIKARRLRYTRPEREGTAGRSFVRAMNFVARGWKFPPGEIAVLMEHTATEVCQGAYEADELGDRIIAFQKNISGAYPIGADPITPEIGK